MEKSEQTFGQPSIIWSHLYLETKNKNLKLINTENRLVVARNWGLGDKQMGKERESKCSKSQLWLSCEDVRYSMVIIVSNTVLFIWKFLDLKILITRKKLQLYGDRVLTILIVIISQCVQIQELFLLHTQN